MHSCLPCSTSENHKILVGLSSKIHSPQQQPHQLVFFKIANSTSWQDVPSNNPKTNPHQSSSLLPTLSSTDKLSLSILLPWWETFVTDVRSKMSSIAIASVIDGVAAEPSQVLMLKLSKLLAMLTVQLLGPGISEAWLSPSPRGPMVLLSKLEQSWLILMLGCLPLSVSTIKKTKQHNNEV